MSLLDTASLLLTPNAYKEGKLYSVIPSDGSGDFTFTRATTATRVNSDGLVELVPYNLLTYSEDFSSNWGLSNTTKTSGQIDPFGGNKAIKLQYNTNNSSHYTVQSGISLTGNNAHSVYAKAGELQFLQIASAQNVEERANFNLANGTIGTYGSLASNVQIENVGGGWYRCSVVFTNGSNGIYCVIANSASMNWFASSPFAGANTTDGLYLYGAQLNEGSLLPYQKTETRLNIPRLDYSLGGCPNILLEPQRTNLALQSSSFDSASWTKSNSIVTPNVAISPSGVQDADTLTADGTSSGHQVTQSISLTGGATYSISFYAKKNTNNFIQFVGANAVLGLNSWANFDLENGVVGSVGSLTTASIESVGNGWYRCIVNVTATATATSNAFILNMITSATSIRGEANSLSTSVYIWGAQLEAGSYATSYIPTTTASVTRNADIISKPNLGTYMSPQNNTIFFDFTTISGGQNTNIFRFNTSSGNTIQFWYFLITNSINIQLGGVFYNTGILSGKVAIQINPTDTKMFVNGVLSATAGTTGVVTTLTSPMDIYSNGATMNCKTMQVYNTSLSDAECIALTTL